MSAWPTKKLGEVIELHYGKGIARHDRNSNGKYPIYGANGELGRTDKFLVDGDALIIGRKGTAGEVTRVSGRFWPADVTYYVFGDEQVDVDYLFYVLKRLDLKRLATGIKPGINRNKVYELEISLPPIGEQKRIVEKIEKLFAKIDEASRLCVESSATSAALLPSTLHRIFSIQNFHSAIRANRRIAKKRWEEKELNECARFIDYRGKTPRKTNKGLPLITAKNVKWGFLNKEPREFVDPDIYDSWMTRGIPQKGDVLFTTEAPLGNVAQLDTDEKVAFAQRIIILQPQTNVDPAYLKYSLMSEPIRERIYSMATGTMAKGIRSKYLKTVKIPLPPIAEQKKIVAYLDAFSQKARELQNLQTQTAADFSALRQSILHQTFQHS